MAVLLAEGVAGSVDAFAAEMNANARRLGMVQSNFVNPNGLPADEQTVSARDLAILARALIREFPEYDDYWHLPGIKFGRRVIRNYNKLLDLYPGADGMKTGFICASGFNLVATATRNGRRLIAVVLGAPSASVRTYHAARLLEQGFNSNWMTPSPGTVDQLVPVNAAPPDLREETCGPHRKRPAAEDEEVSFNDSDGNSPLAFMRSPNPKPSQLLGQQVSLAPPVDVFVGMVKPGSAAAAAAQEDQIEQPKGKGKKGKLAKKKGAKGTDTASQDASETPTPPAARAKPHRAKSATASSSDDTAAAGTTAPAKPKAKKATVAAAPSDDSGAAASKSKPRPAKTAAPAGAANAISAPAKPASAQQ
jgi:D-alanyl-D-alanine carboxypeptidase